MGASLAQDHAHFSSGCGFIVGLGKPKLCTKFEVASFSYCVNNLPGNLTGAAAPVGMDHSNSEDVAYGQADVQSVKKLIDLFLKRS